MSYADRLASLRQIQKHAHRVLTEPTKGASGSFVSAEQAPSAEKVHPDSLQQAAEAVGMDPAILAALLSPEDHRDRAAGTLEYEELAAFARSVVGRWKTDAVLPDERRLYRHFMSERRHQHRLKPERSPREADHGEE
ncbi:hypothetical protein [Thioalkalivibrio sp. ALJ15]|uniref:hypothetical protein n=1 Tax=Thioalkalivibrio sp. ALJ15 TaxID=748652 RepID=UPI0012E9E2D9|nr:hypothetical protein [Thioalkalivibrio sp. ALJ15]